MQELSNTEAELKKAFLMKKTCVASNGQDAGKHSQLQIGMKQALGTDQA